MEYRWVKEFFISYIWEMFIKLLIILTIFYWGFLHFALVVAFKFGQLRANWLKFFRICREEWRAATIEANLERESYRQLILLEQYEKEKE